MRIIKEIERGTMKVTVFKMNEKLSVKFEDQLNEIILKFRDGASVHEDDNMDHFLNDSTLEYYSEELEKCNKFKIDQLIKLEENKGFQFPEII